MNAHDSDRAKKSAEFRRIAIAYLRVSTDGQGESGVGLDAQRASIERFCQLGGFALVQTHAEVASARGHDNLLRRPKLLEALKEADRLGAVLIVDDWARLTRTQSDKPLITTLLPEDRILAVEGGEDLSKASEAGRLAYHERKGEHISRSTKEGMARKKALEGAVFGNPDILSLQASGTVAASEKAQRLREDIAAVLDEHGGLAHGLANRELADILNTRGLRTGQDKLFNHRTVAAPRKGAEDILRQRIGTTAAPGNDDTNEDDPPLPVHWGRF